MTAHALMQVDKATFFRFLEKADDGHRYEFVRGWIMQQQAGGTRRHAKISANFLVAIAAQLDGTAFSVVGSDLAIDTGESIRYADVVVEHIAAGTDDSLTTESPVVIVEVLSPSSEERDLAEKAREYTGLPSLRAYIVAAQDEPVCYVWECNASGQFETVPQTITGFDAVIYLATSAAALPDLEIRLQDIYQPVMPTPPQKD